jgi:hypothetical protein
MQSKRRGTAIKCFVACLATAAMPLLPSTASGSAQTFTEISTVPISQVFFYECTGEEVAVTGEIHFVVHSTLDGNGGFHDLGPSSASLSGVGLTSGDHYEFIIANPGQRNETGASEIGLVSHFNIIAPGSDNNQLGQFTSHVTIDANGNVTAFVMDEHFITCSGG